MYGATVGSTFNPTSGRKDKKQAQQLTAAKEKYQGVDPEAKYGKINANEKQAKVEKDAALKAGERYLIHDFNGVVKAGEMLLVVVSGFKCRVCPRARTKLLARHRVDPVPDAQPSSRPSLA